MFFCVVFLIWQKKKNHTKQHTHLYSGLTSNFYFSCLQNATCLFPTVPLFRVTHDDIKLCACVNLPLSSQLNRMMPFTIQIKSEPCVTAPKLLFIKFFMLSCSHAVVFFLMSLSLSLILPSGVVVLNNLI